MRKTPSDTVTAGGGWVFQVPREAAAQGHTAFECWAATEGSPWLPSFPCPYASEAPGLAEAHTAGVQVREILEEGLQQHVKNKMG